MKSSPVPSKDRSWLDEQHRGLPRWSHARGESHHEALPRSPPDAAPVKLSLGNDELLPEQCVLANQCAAIAEKRRGQALLGTEENHPFPTS
jgi:hypothetical protein